LLGFIKQWLKEFDDPYITKTIHVSLVRLKLEYGSPVCSPKYGIYFDRIESVQIIVLIFGLRRLNWDTYLILPLQPSRLLLTHRRTILFITLFYVIAPTWLAS